MGRGGNYCRGDEDSGPYAVLASWDAGIQDVGENRVRKLGNAASLAFVASKDTSNATSESPDRLQCFALKQLALADR